MAQNTRDYTSTSNNVVNMDNRPYHANIPAADSTGSGGNGSGGGEMLEARVAKLESHAEHIQSDVTDIKQSIKDVTADVSSNFRWVIGVVLVSWLSLAGMIVANINITNNQFAEIRSVIKNDSAESRKILSEINSSIVDTNARLTILESK